ncbi:hypothetical protein F8154_14620 [Alkaliphilus pronyensis]|uniref:HTH luxR-type domain-containing protein n=1 Tax=Alkaliphilus pronyensis TaxID=1482732 RepID=A0A6I0F7H4_9FIRM|nr:LuxR C-terminal-related transcriptional regulator [Alkaliphilus pronyensis]KAB3529597.1 hypothetical protein F8154_14620 [Alkaliphilus pronyensis]
MYNNSAAWVDLHAEYKDSLKKIKQVKEKRRNTGILEDVVDCQVAGSMESDLNQSVREIKNRVMQEYNSITEEDIKNPIYGLTERQKEVALLRQRYSCSEVARILNIEQCTVFLIYKKSISKIIKLKSKQKKGESIILTDRENEVYILYASGLKPKAISEKLDISVNTVKYNLRMIKEKTGGKIIKVEKTG